MTEHRTHRTHVCPGQACSGSPTPSLRSASHRLSFRERTRTPGVSGRAAMSETDPMMEKVVELWRDRRYQEGSSEAVYATLREAILSKVLRPGPQFAEEDLARVFGVSRTPIREAI